jgi:hypothetical protein
MSKSDDAPVPESRFRRIIKKIWWLHSFGALGFGVAMMLFARSGLKYADKVLIALFGSWFLMFVALRFVVGPANRKPDEKMIRRGMRVVTNYVIKQFYQQMFFFLVPLYASSATWSFSSGNWWLAPILLVCGVLSTLDLVFDHFIMERRWLASVMYGLAMFGVLNVLVPLVFGLTHLTGLFVAAAATPIGVALLTFSVRSVMSPQGVILTILSTGGLFGAVWIGRGAIPPAPLAMPETTIGDGTVGTGECLPPSRHVLRVDAERAAEVVMIDGIGFPGPLAGLRCGSLLREPGGIKEDVVHVWRWNGNTLATVKPDRLACDDDAGDAVVFRSFFPPGSMPREPVGTWSCTTKTVGGQLVGVRKVEVVAPRGGGSGGPSSDGSGSPSSDGSGSGSGSGNGGGDGSGGGSGSGGGGGGGSGGGGSSTR